eukprot:TRINITY_DN9346_c0_g1_i2.p1 TRINITY_DN9346_c0_g1~~TRINITY_DN9346_c0_g1_i2.p1  ORF type:complete len:344 (-),score=76.82 TRINITY_DN9346_c0_g1_i2:525-1556(-)
MKGLFKAKPKTPADVVRTTRELLATLESSRDPRTLEKVLEELSRSLREMKIILYGDSENEPTPEASTQLTAEVFKDNFFRVLVTQIPRLEFEARKDASQVVANLQRQQVNNRYVAADYLERNQDLIDLLVNGYENQDIALIYGAMLRETIRHQSVAKYILNSPNLDTFFKFVEVPNFDVASDAMATFRELLTRHKSTVSDFLNLKYTTFFDQYNTKLLQSPNYITRRQAVKLLGDILLDRSNISIMLRYVNEARNLRTMMILLKESSKQIQIEAFHVFKVFVANGNKPAEITNILSFNKDKLLRFLADFHPDKEDEQFDQDKAQVVAEIKNLSPPPDAETSAA